MGASINSFFNHQFSPQSPPVLIFHISKIRFHHRNHEPTVYLRFDTGRVSRSRRDSELFRDGARLGGGRVNWPGLWTTLQNLGGHENRQMISAL
jgi:hypothetical protein